MISYDHEYGDIPLSSMVPKHLEQRLYLIFTATVCSVAKIQNDVDVRWESVKRDLQHFRREVFECWRTNGTFNLLIHRFAAVWTIRRTFWGRDLGIGKQTDLYRQGVCRSASGATRQEREAHN